VATATRLLDRQLQMIHLPPDQSITLTARQGSIPITVVSTAPYNPFVRIKLSSTKLKFHDIVVVGGTCQPGATAETCVLTLHNENTTLKVPVNAPTPGVFRLTVDLESANGALSFAHTQYTVRSTAASGVGIFLSIGAALLLVLWWIRDLRHGRRARRLVPSEDDEPALHAAQAGPEFGSDEWLYRQLGLEWPPPEVSQPAGSLAANRSTPLIVRPIVPLTPAPDLDPITAPIPIISLRGPAVAPAAPPRPAERAPVAAPGTRVRTGEGGGSDRTRVAPPPPPRVPSGRTARGRDRDLPAAFGHNTTVMAAGTMLSRLTGFARVLAVIWAFHLLGLADAYNLANNVPNILYDLVLGGVLSATLVPVFVDYLGREDKDEGWRAVSAVCTAIFAVLLVLTALFFLLVPVIIRFYLVLNHGAGVADERAIGTTLLRLFVPQLFILGGIAVTTALLNARRHFLAPAFSPVFNNLITIAAVVAARLVASSLGPKSFRHDTTALLILGLGTTAGYLVQLLMQLPPMLRGRVRLRPVWDLHHPAVRTVLRLSLWTFGAVVANQVAYNLVLVFAARKTGDVTVFQTAYTFFQLPYAIFAVSIASVITPDLSERWARGDVAGFRRQMASGLRLTLTFLIPAAVGYVLLAHPLLTLILRHGTFSAGDAHKIGTVVALFAVGLPGFSAYLLLMRGYQAMQDTRSMFWLYVIENAATIVLALALYPVMGVSGLALGWVSAYTLGTAVTFFRLRRRTGGLEGLATARTLLRVGMASVVMAGAVWAVRVGFNGVSDARLVAEILGGGAVGTVIYVMFCRALGVAEVDLLLRRRRS
jgi:putative peptidoglycan lipid II flippase